MLCGLQRDTVKRMCIKRLPPVLCIQLKRFGYDWEANRALKFDDHFKVRASVAAGEGHVPCYLLDTRCCEVVSVFPAVACSSPGCSTWSPTRLTAWRDAKHRTSSPATAAPMTSTMPAAPRRYATATIVYNVSYNLHFSNVKFVAVQNWYSC